ncbi:MAG: MarR family transcriptional regulator [bacterium]
MTKPKAPTRAKVLRAPAPVSTDATLAFGRIMIRGGLQSISTTIQEVDLTLTQLGTLILLQHRGALSVSDVAAHRQLSLSATSHMLSRLVERKFVVRTENPEDRRQKRITLGPEGAKLLVRFDQGREQALVRLFRDVPPSLVTELDDTIARVLTYLSNSPPGTVGR